MALLQARLQAAIVEAKIGRSTLDAACGRTSRPGRLAVKSVDLYHLQGFLSRTKGTKE